jgi:peptidylprolyl isomerase
MLALCATGCRKKVQMTANGVTWEVIKEGTGASPKQGDSVSVHYTGWLEDGTKFDSSTDRNEPFSYRYGRGQVIQGWEDALATLKVGGKSKFTIPSELGYGARGAGGVIPPNATLIFDIELLAIIK